jgi:peptidoglycan/xylan/chitin deacetylase (PgdA/CDA1 family)
MEPSPRHQRLLLIIAAALGVLLVGAFGVVSWLSENARAKNEAATETRLAALEQKVDDLQRVVTAAQADNLALKNEMEGGLLSIQAVYFDTLKRNDGLAPVWGDTRPGRRAYLTFDDGPTENTAEVLDALKAGGVKATFFVNGRPEQADMYRRIIREGHRIGNHTYSHDYNLIYQSVDNYMKDTDKLDALLASLSLPPTKLYRFPGGAKNEIAARLGGPALTGKISGTMADRGYRFFEWNVAVGEGESRPEARLFASPDIATSVLAQAKAKRVAVILLHDGPGHKATADAVPAIIQGLRKLGFTLEQLP